MIHLYFVGDGPRDEATLPRLVERIRGAEVNGPFKEWRHVRLHGKSGYAGKMKFAVTPSTNDLGNELQRIAVPSPIPIPTLRLRNAGST